MGERGNDDQLVGDMGVSSERVIDPDAVDGGIEGTGTHGSAVGRTHGTADTSPVEPDTPVEPVTGQDDDN